MRTTKLRRKAFTSRRWPGSIGVLMIPSCSQDVLLAVSRAIVRSVDAMHYCGSKPRAVGPRRGVTLERLMKGDRAPMETWTCLKNTLHSLFFNRRPTS